jgi:hypothetical protein
MKYNLYSVILDALDQELIGIARGNRPELVKLVQWAMDGEIIDPASISAEEVKYVKTVKVLLGEVLYSDSWLES